MHGSAKVIHRLVGPASRVLQGTTVDLSAAAMLLNDCRKQFKNVTINSDATWDGICKRSITFALQHGISADFPDERRRAKKRLVDELRSHECLTGK